MWVVSANTQFATVTEKTISGVYVSPGSAETLVRKGGITNHHSLAYSVSNISAKKYHNQLTCVEVIIYCTTSVSVFWDANVLYSTILLEALYFWPVVITCNRLIFNCDRLIFNHRRNVSRWTLVRCLLNLTIVVISFCVQNVTRWSQRVLFLRVEYTDNETCLLVYCQNWRLIIWQENVNKTHTHVAIHARQWQRKLIMNSVTA